MGEAVSLIIGTNIPFVVATFTSADSVHDGGLNEDAGASGKLFLDMDSYLGGKCRFSYSF